jgi:hypothetical protein
VIAVPDTQARPVVVSRTRLGLDAASTARAQRVIEHLLRAALVTMLIAALFSLAYWLDSRGPSPGETPRGDEIGVRGR